MPLQLPGEQESPYFGSDLHVNEYITRIVINVNDTVNLPMVLLVLSLKH
jgi:hypothetical protein